MDAALPTKLLAVALGGGAGSVARYLLSACIAQKAGSGFPWGTLAVNLIGAFAIGLIVEILALKASWPETVRLLLVTGVLGGFTTFSAFSLETALLIERGAFMQAGAYIALSVLGTVVLVFIAMGLVRQFA